MLCHGFVNKKGVFLVSSERMSWCHLNVRAIIEEKEKEGDFYESKSFFRNS